MDKFIIRSQEKDGNICLDGFEDLYDIINKRSRYVIKEVDTKLNGWQKMIQEWYLIKYQNDDIDDNIVRCSCHIKYRIYISNDDHIISICHCCINLFPHIDKIYSNIDRIVHNIINDMFYQINYDLMIFLNLDHNTVDKYNKNGCKNRRNIKIYCILSTVGLYHYKINEFKDKLNSMYTKITRAIDVDEIVDKLESCLSKIKWCQQCYPLNLCFNCFQNNNKYLEDITEEQFKVLWKVYRHIFNDTNIKYGLYGSAGTGKTTLIKYILQLSHLNELFILKDLQNILKLDLKNYNKNKISELLDEYNNKFDKKINGLLIDVIHGDKIVVLASPTNKALDVIREKVGSISNFVLSDNFTGHINHLNIIFFTISKLLTYHRFIDTNHHMYFKRSAKYLNIIDRYNLIIIDESSMINKDNIVDIKYDIETSNKFIDSYKKGYIIFTGDKAQLPPPKEQYSSVFKLKMNKTELTTVMRTDKKMIIDLCNFIRKWIEKDKDNIRNELLSHKCEYVKFHMNSKKFIDQYSKTTDAIILVWTNETRNRYNKAIREILFGEITSKRFLVNEHIIFNNFYKIKTKTDERVFYSSMPIIVRDININKAFLCEKYRLEIIMEKIDEIMKTDISLIDLFKDNSYKKLKEYIDKFVHMFNNSMNSIFKVWELYFIYKNMIEEYPIYVIYHQKKYIKCIEQGKRYIKEYFDKSHNILSQDIRNSVREIIVELFDQYYEQPFADVNYGYCITTDKSQGSTFDCVYIDAADMLDQNKYPFLDLNIGKKRFYTAVTRSAKQVNILI